MRASPWPACFALTHPPAYGTKAIGSLTQSQAEAGQLWPPTLTSTGSANTQQTWWQVDWGHCRWRYPKTVLSRQNFQGWGGEKGTNLILVLLRNRRCRLAVWGVEVGEHWGDDTATCVFWAAWNNFRQCACFRFSLENNLRCPAAKQTIDVSIASEKK